MTAGVSALPWPTTWTGTWLAVAVGAVEADGPGEGAVARPAQPATKISPAMPAASSNRIVAYYGESKRHDLEKECRKDTDRIDSAVDHQGDQAGRQAERECPRQPLGRPRLPKNPAQNHGERESEGT